MTGPLTLGIDIGTFESKGVLVDVSGAIVAQASRAHEMIVPRPGWAEHDPIRDWWGDFVYLCRSLLDQSGVPATRIACVATSAIGPCLLPVDADGTPLSNGILYGVDTRASAQIDAMNDRIGADVILAQCGNALTSQSVGPKIQWLKDTHPEVFENTAHFLTSTSFLVQKLTGQIVIDHYTAANFSPFYDVEALNWTQHLCPGVVRDEQLPRLMWSGEIAGHVTAQAAAECGLAEGTPVTCGTIDAAAEAVSVGVQSSGDMMMMYGSTIFIIALTKKRLRDPRLWYAPWLYPDQHAAMAGLATSGTLTHWFRDHFARELPRDTAFATLAAEAETSAPGANGLLLLPYFSGERTPIHDPHARGSFFGLNLTHTRGDMYRALLEGIAFGTRHAIETFGAAGQTPSRVLAVGGGTRNELWLRATSDTSGLAQIVKERTIGASYGDAFLAACAVGLAAPGDIDKWNTEAKRIAPRPDPALERNYALFRQLYTQTRDIARELGAS